MKNSKNNIKISVALAALLVMGVLRADAQKGEIGVRFMPTFSSLNLNTSAGGTVKGEITLGYGVGALLGYNFSEHVGVQGEIIYTSIAQKYDDVDVQHRINLRYVNIPLMLSLNSGRTKAVNFNIVGGPQIGYSAGSSVETTGGDGTNSTQAILVVKKGDLGVAYGAGVDFALNPEGNFRLGLGYRGVLGLFDISDNSNSLATDSYYILDRTRIKTNAGYIGLTFLF